MWSPSSTGQGVTRTTCIANINRQTDTNFIVAYTAAYPLVYMRTTPHHATHQVSFAQGCYKWAIYV